MQRLLVRPSLEQPSLLLPLDDAGASRYAVEHWSLVDRRWKVARMIVARELMRTRLFPQLPTCVTVSVRTPGLPFIVASAVRRLGLPPTVRPLLTLGLGDVLSRNIFHLFPAEGTEPAWVLKFARVPDYAEPFDRDARGLALAARAGGSVAAHAPRLLVRFDDAGIHANVETAAVGYRLRDLLLRPGRRHEKLRLIDRVAEWILQMARATAVHSSGSEILEQRRLVDEAIERGAIDREMRDLAADLPPLPAVLQHNDLGSWNVIVDDDHFTVLDWELARARGLPLWDLFYFLTDALALLDGSIGGERRHLHTIELFRGRRDSSRILFEWTRRAVDDLKVPAEAVGAIATLCWLHHALTPLRRRDAMNVFARGGVQAVHGTERVADAWLAEPELGVAWTRWRER
jgi:hypothetical protein